MEVLIVNQEQVAELLPMPECIEVMERVLKSLSAGECLLPLRQITWLSEKTRALGLMPSYWKSAETIGLKAVAFFPGNEGTECDTHQGVRRAGSTRPRSPPSARRLFQEWPPNCWPGKTPAFSPLSVPACRREQ